MLESRGGQEAAIPRQLADEELEDRSLPIPDVA